MEYLEFFLLSVFLSFCLSAVLFDMFPLSLYTHILCLHSTLSLNYYISMCNVIHYTSKCNDIGLDTT